MCIAGGVVGYFGLWQECKESSDSHQHTVLVLIGPVFLLPEHGVHAYLNCHHLCHPCAVDNAAGTVALPSPAGTAAGTLEGEGEKRCVRLGEHRSLPSLQGENLWIAWPFDEVSLAAED